MTRTEKRAATIAAQERMAAARAATLAVVQSGQCPCCGSSLRRNSSLAGWYQCAQFGAAGFRADSAKPSCDWQEFTE